MDWIKGLISHSNCETFINIWITYKKKRNNKNFMTNMSGNSYKGWKFSKQNSEVEKKKIDSFIYSVI